MSDTTEHEIVGEYMDLLETHLGGDVDASQFSRDYLEKFKSDDRSMSDETFWILQNLFVEADAYCEPEIREDVSDGIGDAELTEAAREALAKLEQRSEESVS